nr:40S ribosomal protein S21-2-like [Cryptomonas curvata]
MENNFKNINSNYFPRKCSSTNKILTSRDHSSIQIKIGRINRDGYFDGKSDTYVLCGFLRKSGKADNALNCLVEIDKEK